MTPHVITDQKHAPLFCRWLESRLPGVGSFDPAECRTVAVVDANSPDAAILGVVAFNRWTPHACDASVATDGVKRACWRPWIRTLYEYAFVHADKSRINFYVDPDNAASIRVQHALGHTLDARLPSALGDGRDALLFGLTREQWMRSRWAQRPVVINTHNNKG